MLTTLKNGIYKFLNPTLDTFENQSVALRNFQTVLSGDKFSYDIRISVVEGDYTNKDYTYEDYGASPSPEFPSEIKSVGDDSTLEINQYGKNFFNANLITRKDVVIENNGQKIIMPIVTSGSGYINLGQTLAELCPFLKVGDKAVLKFDTTSNINKYIHLLGIAYTWKINEELTITKETLNSYVYLYANNFKSGETEQVIITDMSIILSSETDQTYEPYFSNSYVLLLSEPLRSLPNGVCDTIEEDGVHRRVGSVVLNGSEDWFMPASTEYSILKSSIHNMNASSRSLNMLCDYFKVYQVAYGVGYFRAGESYLNFNFDNNVGGLDNFKSWLQQNPITLQYELTEEVIEPFTDEQQEIIDNIRTNLYTQYFSSETNMRITYVRNNGLSNMYEIKNNAEKKYSETSKKIAELNIETEGIKTNVEEVITSIGEVTDSLDKNINLLSVDMQKKLEELGKSLTDYQLTVSTQFEQTNKDFNFLFNNIIEQINSSSENTSEKFAEIVKYIRFEDGNIILGRSDNELILKQSNDRISFIQNDNEVAYFSNNKLYVKEIEVTEKLFLANFAFVPESNGSLSFKKVRG